MRDVGGGGCVLTFGFDNFAYFLVPLLMFLDHKRRFEAQGVVAGKKKKRNSNSCLIERNPRIIKRRRSLFFFHHFLPVKSKKIHRNNPKTRQGSDSPPPPPLTLSNPLICPPASLSCSTWRHTREDSRRVTWGGGGD